MTWSQIVFSSNFSTIRERNGYYVDKTAFLEPLLSTYEEARLFTRPRRFGKSLAMSMLADFVDISKDSRKLFDGLEISKNNDLCESWMNKYPVVKLSLVLCEGDTFDRAVNSLKKAVWNLYRRHQYLKESDKIFPEDKEFISAVMRHDVDAETIQNSIDRLVSMVASHYEKKVIFIVDEYDRLIENSAYGNFYEKMKFYIRPMYGSVIKDNENVEYSFLTGCARVSIDSISSGLNNVTCYDVNSAAYSEMIGFTEDDVDRLLYDVDLIEKKSDIKEWYDGYTFGNTKGIYCPWDVLKFIYDCKNNDLVEPQAYWENTGSLTTVKVFLQKIHPEIDDKIVLLGNGGHVSCKIRKELNFATLFDAHDNIWTLLYYYGYVTKAEKQNTRHDNFSIAVEEDVLVVPNKSVNSAILNEIVFCLRSSFMNHSLDKLTSAFINADAETVQDELTELLLSSVSDFDYHEYFYHAWLLGLLTACGGSVVSNQQSGLGRPDLVCRFQNTVMIVELKRESTNSTVPLEDVADRALRQVFDRKYDAPHVHVAHASLAPRVVCWGMGFRGRECRVVTWQSNAGSQAGS